MFQRCRNLTDISGVGMSATVVTGHGENEIPSELIVEVDPSIDEVQQIC